VRRIVTTRHLDWHRRRSSRERPSDSFREDAEPVTGRPAASVDHAGRVADHDELERALSALSRPQRAVLVLRYYEGYDDAAIAGVLGCAPATVRSHAHRGLARLRADLAAPSPVYAEEK
jgi:RNA polymerase sigma factor (sigma-70 family)